MTEMEKAAAERLRDSLEQFLCQPCPNSAPCIFCELASACTKARTLYIDVKRQLGEEVKNV